MGGRSPSFWTFGGAKPIKLRRAMVIFWYVFVPSMVAHLTVDSCWRRWCCVVPSSPSLLAPSRSLYGCLRLQQKSCSASSFNCFCVEIKSNRRSFNNTLSHLVAGLRNSRTDCETYSTCRRNLKMSFGGQTPTIVVLKEGRRKQHRFTIEQSTDCAQAPTSRKGKARSLRTSTHA